MYKLFLITKLIIIGTLTSIKNIFIERKVLKFVKYHNRTVKKAIRIYNRRLRVCSNIKMKQERLRDQILNNKDILVRMLVSDMQRLSDSIDKIDESIVREHKEFVNFLQEVFDKAKCAINEYNELAEKQNRIPYLFYRCNKIPLSSIIRNLKYANRDASV